MKTLVVLLLASLVATSAFAVADPDPDMIGVYFDLNADSNCLPAPTPGVPFFAYIILTNTTAPAINAYEMGYEVVTTGSYFRLADSIANGVVSGVNVGDATNAAAGDYIVGLASPLPGTPAVVLHSMQYLVTVPAAMEWYLTASSAPSLPGNFPVVQNAEGSILMTVGQSTGGPEFPVATAFGDCVVGVEDVS